MVSCGPHQMNNSNRECMQIDTEVRRLCGHWCTGPSGVADQSISRISAPVSPPPANTCAFAICSSCSPMGSFSDGFAAVEPTPYLEAHIQRHLDSPRDGCILQVALAILQNWG